MTTSKNIENAKASAGETALKAAAATAAVGIVASQASAAAGDSLPHVLVQLYLRGGADGLTLCVPIDEPNYHAKRTETRVYHPTDPAAPVGMKADLLQMGQLGSGGQLLLTGFGLPPALAPLKPLYDTQRLVFVHGCGSLDPTRSHFAQQDFTERGENSNSTMVDGLGWIGRHLATSSPLLGSSGSLRALSFNSLGIKSFSGGNGVTPTLEPENFTFPITDPLIESKLSAMYDAQGGVLDTAYDNDKGAVAKLMGVTWTIPTGAYPSSELGSQFQRAFDIIRDVPDIEAISMDYDNIAGQRWDTHAAQGVFSGTMNNLMNDLATTLAAFLADTGTINRKVIVLVYSEFGRTLQENVAGGTDHGRGGVAMLLGDGVNGKKVVTQNWAGLDNAVLDPPTTGDLPVTLDLRDVMTEIATDCLGNTAANVFPDGTYTPIDHDLIT